MSSRYESFAPDAIEHGLRELKRQNVLKVEWKAPNHLQGLVAASRKRVACSIYFNNYRRLLVLDSSCFSALLQMPL